MSTATLTKKELFVQGSLTTDVAEMIEMLAVNVPGVKSCNVNAVNKSLVLSIDTTKDEGAVINELSSLIKTMDSSLKLTTSRQENKNNSKAQRKSADGDKNVSIILGGLNCAHCAEVIGQKVSGTLELCPTSNLNTKVVDSIGQYPIRQLMDAGGNSGQPAKDCCRLLLQHCH